MSWSVTWLCCFGGIKHSRRGLSAMCVTRVHQERGGDSLFHSNSYPQVLIPFSQALTPKETRLLSINSPESMGHWGLVKIQTQGDQLSQLVKGLAVKSDDLILWNPPVPEGKETENVPLSSTHELWHTLTHISTHVTKITKCAFKKYLKDSIQFAHP